MGDGVVFLEKYGKPYIEITDDGRCYIKMWKDGKYYICECGSSKCRIYVPVWMKTAESTMWSTKTIRNHNWWSR